MVLEGPAGSGKSYLGERLHEHYKVPLIRGSIGARKVTDQFIAAIASSVNDYTKIVRACATSQKGFCVVDRLILAQMVYGELRSSGYAKVLSESFMFEPIRDLHHLIDMAIKELSWRSGFKAEIPSEVAWLILTPPVAQIKRNRRISSKKYGWEVADELKLYRRLGEKMGAKCSAWNSGTSNTFPSTLFHSGMFTGKIEQAGVMDGLVAWLKGDVKWGWKWLK